MDLVFKISSKIASETWSAILSGCPSVTDSEVNSFLIFAPFLTLSKEKTFPQKEKV